MQTRQSTSVATAAIVSTTPKAAAHTTVRNAEQELAPAWLLASLRWQVLNSPAEWQLSSKVCQLVERGGITMAEALLMQEHIQHEIEKQDVEARKRLCRLMTETIESYPELFANKWYGAQYVADVRVTIEHHGHSWKYLDAANQRLDTVVEMWKNTRHLVDQALVDGIKMASDIRKAVRPSNHTHATDCATAQHLARKLFRLEASELSNYTAKTAAEQLYELLTDSMQPADLVRAMQQALA